MDKTLEKKIAIYLYRVLDGNQFTQMEMWMGEHKEEFETWCKVNGSTNF